MTLPRFQGCKDYRLRRELAATLVNISRVRIADTMTRIADGIEWKGIECPGASQLRASSILLHGETPGSAKGRYKFLIVNRLGSRVDCQNPGAAC
jgi:hypothetical protein